MQLPTYKAEFIEFMVRSGVLLFGDFTTKSGRKTPYFVNTGLYKTGAQAEQLGNYYATAIKERFGDEFDFLFGPAYKGIPLCTLAAASLSRQYGIDKGYCFNRKEEKDHGEGGSLVGWKPKDGERVLLVEDVITAGTAVREVHPILKGAADVSFAGMIISVNRMEKGYEGLTAIQEIKRDFGIEVHAIVTVLDILEHLYKREIDGKVIITDELKARMEAYISEYCLI